MALWDVYQVNTYLWNARQTTDFIRTVDDAQATVSNDLLSLFGVEERANVQVTTPQAGTIEAKIQYSTANRTGWVRDREAQGDYIVIFRAVRR